MPSATLPDPSASLAPALGQHSELGTQERRWVIGAIAGAHLLGAWGLLQIGAVREQVREMAPLMFSLVTPDAPTPPEPTPPPPSPAPRPLTRPTPAPVIAAAPSPAPAPAAMEAPAPAPVPVPAEAPPSPPAPPAPPAPPPPPPAPKLIPATAVQYLAPPPVAVPLASRRLGESGTVLLKVWVDTRGLPRQVQLHKSSGFARLDAQAQEAMRLARFKPQTDNGVAIEWIVIAPIQYELE